MYLRVRESVAEEDSCFRIESSAGTTSASLGGYPLPREIKVQGTFDATARLEKLFVSTAYFLSLVVFVFCREILGL